jgi:hypothetical protein
MSPFIPVICNGVIACGPTRVDYFYPIVVHALPRFGPGDLWALRVGDAGVFRVILAMLDAQGGAPTPQLAEVLDSLCAIELASIPGRASEPKFEMAALVSFFRFKYAFSVAFFFFFIPLPKPFEAQEKRLATSWDIFSCIAGRVGRRGPHRESAAGGCGADW